MPAHAEDEEEGVFFFFFASLALDDRALDESSLRLSLGPSFGFSSGSSSLLPSLIWDPAGQLVTPVRWNSGSRVVSK